MGNEQFLRAKLIDGRGEYPKDCAPWPAGALAATTLNDRIEEDFAGGLKTGSSSGDMRWSKTPHTSSTWMPLDEQLESTPEELRPIGVVWATM